MNKLSNALRVLSWKVRKRLDLSNQTIAPILWNKPTFTSDQGPSPSFIEKLDESHRAKLDFVVKEVEMVSRMSNRFPVNFTDKSWRMLLQCQTRKQRIEYLSFMSGVEKKRQKDREEVKQKKEKPLIPKNEAEQHSFWNVASKTEVNIQNFKVVNAHRLGAPAFVVDCRFLPSLSPRGAELTALQLNYLVSSNRTSTHPFQLFYTNFDEQNPTVSALKKRHLGAIDSIKTPTPIAISNCFSEIFPKDKIVYLSPDAEKELETVDDDAVYVVGGIVDRVVERGIDKKASLNAAKMSGVEAVRLPIDKYVKFKSGSKFLTLPAVMEILREVYVSANWEKAFEKSIPVRNLRGPEEKNSFGRVKHERIREFNRQMAKIIQEKLGDEPKFE